MCPLVWFFLILFIFCKQVYCATTTNPCPHVFQYQETSSGVKGLILVDIPKNYNNFINVEVQFSIGNEVGKDVGKLEVMNNDDEAAKEKLQNNEPILFTLIFPVWHTILPQITKIKVNENEICRGKPITQLQSRYIATVTLNCKLTIYFKPTLSSTEWNRQNFPIQNSPRFPIFENSLHINPTTSTTSPSPVIFNLPTTSVKKSLNTQPFSKVCGLVSPTIKLIANGETAKKSDYPWIGGLFKAGDQEAKFTCGASLITDRHALTAGHCVVGVAAKRFYLVLGREYINNWLSGGETIQITNTFVHQDVKREHGDADIGILVLIRKVDFSPMIRPICLWNSDDDINLVIGQSGVVAGWGQDENQRLQNMPKQTGLPIVSEEECVQSNDAFNLLTSNRTFCAGYRNETGPCKGDSGNGFYINNNGRWTIRGIVSQAVGTANFDCDLKQYVVFVDVAKFRDWILTNIRN